VTKGHPESNPTWEGVDNNVENFTDLVRYSHANNSQPDSDRRRDSQVESTMDKEATPIDESGVTYDHFLGVEDGGEWEVEFDPSSGAGISVTRGLISCHSDTKNVLNILGNRDEWPSGSANFFMRDHKKQGDGLRGWFSILSLTRKSIVISLHYQSKTCFSISTLHQCTMDSPPQDPLT
jgi:hypothetical protein